MMLWVILAFHLIVSVPRQMLIFFQNYLEYAILASLGLKVAVMIW
jgi:hypothetical protein